MVLYVTHYYYDGLDSDFVSDDLDANRVKIVDTRGATIAGTTVELMDLRIWSYFMCDGCGLFFLFLFLFGTSPVWCEFLIFAIFNTNNIQRKYTDWFFWFINIRSKQRVNRKRERRKKQICRNGILISDTIEINQRGKLFTTKWIEMKTKNDKFDTFTQIIINRVLQNL